MKTIHKYKIDIVSTNLPIGAKIVSFKKGRDNNFYVWAQIDTESDLEERFLHVKVTGHELHEQYNEHIHISTSHDDPYVWHLFEIK